MGRYTVRATDPEPSLQIRLREEHKITKNSPTEY